MATVSTLIEWIASATGVREDAGSVQNNWGGEFNLRALPNEEIYFWVRDVDNSRIVPESDPKSTRACVKYIASASLAALLLIGVLIPVASNILAGYQIHALENRHEALLRTQAELEFEEARMMDPARLTWLGENQHLVDPPPETSVTLGSVSEGALAYNR